MTPTNDESIALAHSSALLRFAAENVANLDPSISLRVAQAIDAHQRKDWTPETSQMFWNTYSELSDLVKPVTIECLNAVTPVVRPRPEWLKDAIGEDRSSLASRTTGLFLATLVVLLVLIVPAQLYTWTLTNLSKDIANTQDQLTTSATNLSTMLSTLNSSLPPAPRAGKSPAPLSADQLGQIDDILRAAPALVGESDFLLDKTNLLRNWTTLWQNKTPLSLKPWVPKAGYVDLANAALDRADQVKRMAIEQKTDSDLVSGILASFVMPLLFGMVGALAYVIRTISAQITTTTFSPTSPIRHVLRVALGALLGVVVGLFSDLTHSANLPPLAIAFLAGYGVEAVFSMFDGVINRFKTPATASGAANDPARVPAQPVQPLKGVAAA